LGAGERPEKDRKMKRLIILTSALAITLTTVGAVAGADITVRVNGERVRFAGIGPREVSGRVMVPLRGVLEQMGATVDWDSHSRTVLASKAGTSIELPVGSRSARVNGRMVNLDVPAMIMQGTTMVPLRFVGEALGADVKWDAPVQTVMIETGLPSSETYSPGADTVRRPIDRDRIPGDTDRRPSDFDRRPADIDRRPIDIDRRPTDDSRPDRPHVARGRRIMLNAGTVIPVRLDNSLDSKSTMAGDRFTTTVRSGQDNAGLPDGTRIEGVIRDAVASSGDKPGILDMEFRRIVYPNGDVQPITASVFSLDSNAVERSGDRLMAKPGKKKDTLKWVGIGAGAGFLLSKVVKGNTLLDTLLGAGAGLLYDQVQGKKPGDVALKPGTEFGVRLDSDMAFTAMDTTFDDSVRPNRIR